MANPTIAIATSPAAEPEVSAKTWLGVVGAALGAFLATLMTGLRIAAKTHPDRDALMRTVDVALTALD